MGVAFQFRHPRVLHVVSLVAYLFLPSMEATPILRFHDRRRFRVVSRHRYVHADFRRLTQHEGSPRCNVDELRLPRAGYSRPVVAQLQRIETLCEIGGRHIGHSGTIERLFSLGDSRVEQNRLDKHLDVTHVARFNVLRMVGKLRGQTFAYRCVLCFILVITGRNPTIRLFFFPTAHFMVCVSQVLSNTWEKLRRR